MHTMNRDIDYIRSSTSGQEQGQKAANSPEDDATRNDHETAQKAKSDRNKRGRSTLATELAFPQLPFAVLLRARGEIMPLGCVAMQLFEELFKASLACNPSLFKTIEAI